MEGQPDWNQGILGNGYLVRIERNVIARNGLPPDNERSNLEHGIYVTGTDIEIVGAYEFAAPR